MDNSSFYREARPISKSAAAEPRVLPTQTGLPASITNSPHPIGQGLGGRGRGFSMR